MSIAQCSVDGCITKCHSKGYCNKHYLQIYRKGFVYKTAYDERNSIVEGNIAKIPLGIGAKGGHAIVDANFSYLDSHCWYKSQKGYASTRDKNTKRIVKMHQLIVEKPTDGLVIDHINRDKLDNRTDNLRIVTVGLNKVNATYSNKTGYRGVGVKNSKKKLTYTSSIGDIHLGTYSTALEAAIQFDKAAREKYGEYAFTNFPMDNY